MPKDIQIENRKQKMYNPETDKRIVLEDYITLNQIQTLKKHKNTCIGISTYNKLMRDIADNFFGLRDVNIYPFRNEDIVGYRRLKFDNNELLDVIIIPKDYRYSKFHRCMEEIIEETCGFPVEVYFSRMRCIGDDDEDHGDGVIYKDTNYRDRGVWVIWKKGMSPFLKHEEMRDEAC